MDSISDDEITKLLDTQVPASLSLSADGTALVYATAFDRSGLARDTEHRVSTIWYAESGKASSARQLTSGLYNDTLPAISPDGQSIVFVSDRAKKGESSALYYLSLSGGEPIPITPKDNEQPITSPKWSPDSKHVAYISADEKDSRRKDKDKKKDDAIVFGQDLLFNRVRVIDITNKIVNTLSHFDRHVTEIAWSYNGERIAFLTTKRPGTESLYCLDTKIHSISADGNTLLDHATFPTYIHSLSYTDEAIYFVGSVSQTSVVGSFALYRLDLHTADALPVRVANGDTDCCLAARSLAKDVVSHVQNGHDDEIRLDGGRTLLTLRNQILSFDVAFTKDSDEIIVAVAKGDINHPPEVYTQTASGGALVQLSKHAAEEKTHQTVLTSFFSCKTSDGQDTIEGVLHRPVYTISTNAINEAGIVPHSPTVVWLHGGPYTRLTNSHNPSAFYFVNVALRLGFTVMLPNYRGSSGRGEAFASKARGGMGIYDEPDVVAATQYCIERGSISKDKVLVAGWSQGGFLSYLCAVRNGMHDFGWKYRAAIPGAGVTDWDTMTFTSDVGPLQAAMAGVPAWATTKDNIKNRTGSPIWEFRKGAEAKVIPPMLMLHGEKDERVPIEQPRAFRLGLDHYNLPYEMVVYPREGHTIKERYHVEDMLRRFATFTQKHLR